MVAVAEFGEPLVVPVLQGRWQEVWWVLGVR